MKITVGIPTRNRAQLLRRAVESALSQDVELEVVVSDNASTDETPEICAAITGQRFRYSANDSPVPAAQNFRRVLTLGTGELFMWLADDDWLSPGYLHACIAELSARTDLLGIVGRGRFVAADGSTRDSPLERCLDSKPGARVLSFYSVVKDNNLFYGLYPRAVLLRTPFRDTFGGDWLTVAALAFVGKLDTIERVTLTRSPGGASEHIPTLARAFYGEGFRARHAWLGVAWKAGTAAAFAYGRPRPFFGWQAYSAVCKRTNKATLLALRSELRIRARFRKFCHILTK